jgi:hypothetical protein
MLTTIKVRVTIEHDRINPNVRGEFNVCQMMFSDYTTLIDAETMVKDVKDCIRALKGFKMITIDMTDDIQYTTYPKQVVSIRFTNHYGEIKMATTTNGGNFTNWKEAKLSDVYKYIAYIVIQANDLQETKILKKSI